MELLTNVISVVVNSALTVVQTAVDVLGNVVHTIVK